MVSSEGEDYLIIKGSSHKVTVATESIRALLAAYFARTTVFTVPADCVPAIVGKKGVKINALRVHHPEVSIDIEGSSSIVLGGGSLEQRQAVCSALLEIVDMNHSTTAPVTSEMAVYLKGSRAAAIRADINTRLNVGMDIDVEKEICKLKGTKAAVDEALLLLQEFMKNSYYEEMPIADEDCVALTEPFLSDPSGCSAASSSDSDILSGSMAMTKALPASPAQSSFSTKLGAEFGVEVYVSRKEGVAKLRGNQVAVRLAVAAVHSFLAGDETRGSACVAVSALAVPTFIGKAGAGIKRFEAEHRVNVDIIRGKSVIRIRNSYDGSGEEAKEHYCALLSGQAVVRLHLTASMLLALPSKPRISLPAVELAYGVTIAVAPAGEVGLAGALVISGKTAGTNSARAELTRLLTTHSRPSWPPWSCPAAVCAQCVRPHV